MSGCRCELGAYGSINVNKLKDVTIGKLGFGLCPNITDWNLKKEQAYLKGSISSTTLNYLSVGIYHCNKDYEIKYGLKCASDEEMKYMHDGYVTMAYTDYTLDPTQK